MSVTRQGTDELRCDVRACRETFWAGSFWHAETTPATEKRATEAGWWTSDTPRGEYGYRHLCPRHKHRTPDTTEEGSTHD